MVKECRYQWLPAHRGPWGTAHPDKRRGNVKYIFTNSVKNVGLHTSVCLHAIWIIYITFPTYWHSCTNEFPQTDSYRFCHGAPGQINKYLANQCRRILWFWDSEYIALAADFRLKIDLCSAVNQRDEGKLHERCSASTEFGEILIYLVLYNWQLFIYFICETGDSKKEIKSLLLNCSRHLTVNFNSYTGLGREMYCHIRLD